MKLKSFAISLIMIALLGGGYYYYHQSQTTPSTTPAKTAATTKQSDEQKITVPSSEPATSSTPASTPTESDKLTAGQLSNNELAMVVLIYGAHHSSNQSLTRTLTAIKNMHKLTVGAGSEWTSIAPGNVDSYVSFTRQGNQITISALRNDATMPGQNDHFGPVDLTTMINYINDQHLGDQVKTLASYPSL
ncbi:hypothetical protein [Limosilactobacillus equigenerosi]|uniref:Uncharacterized protein n=1 Tax=Limosilactobacillus equigenerosi DSM 18793 = JCM 14505 TaxID=1423742 RepID=A0A0R1UVF7_9LACO|nr:hypothetical protein [Limosilactobacillus equigenerosi]KRL94027.1 hypothetical protein FC21_GL001499 [Limosilactobacillus equigenerosi DSM 18793 = JCM 14505]